MTRPDYRLHFFDGVRHFNDRQFWEAHESWEILWLEADSDLVQFLQGLIQLAAAYHHMQRGTLRGAPRLFDAALRRLAPFPLRFSGIDRSAAEESARADMAGLLDGLPPVLSNLPRLSILPTEETLVPPFEQW